MCMWDRNFESSVTVTGSEMWSCACSNKRVKSCYCTRARLSTDQDNLWREQPVRANDLGLNLSVWGPLGRYAPIPSRIRKILQMLVFATWPPCLLLARERTSAPLPSPTPQRGRLFRLRACRARARLDLGLIDTNEVIFQISGPPYLETLFDNCPR